MKECQAIKFTVSERCTQVLQTLIRYLTAREDQSGYFPVLVGDHFTQRYKTRVVPVLSDFCLKTEKPQKYLIESGVKILPENFESRGRLITRVQRKPRF